MAAYALEGPTWASNSITWSFGAFNLAGDVASPFSHVLDGPTETALIRQAFAAWQAVADLHFSEVADTANANAAANIRVGLSPTSTRRRRTRSA